jgi:cytochrome c biogenesis protein CcmG/thiol:disulfide interchange protein DsbE
MRFLWLLLVAGCGSAALPPSAQSDILEKALPTFKRPTVQGGKVSTDESRGKVVVVKFFAKYCEPCKKTLPAAEALHRSSGEDVVFIGIAEDEYVSDVETLIQTYSLSFPVVHDQANALAGRFRVSELPRTFVIDRAGKIRWIGGESQSEDDLEAAVDWVKSQP